MKLFGERLFSAGFPYFIEVLEGLVKERDKSDVVAQSIYTPLIVNKISPLYRNTTTL